MARKKLTKAEREWFEAERRRTRENNRKLLELAERAQAKLDAQRDRTGEK